MKLAVLNLRGTRIDGPGLANLAGLADLKTIYINSSQVSDDRQAGLEKLTALRALNSRAGIERLRKALPRVRVGN